MSVHRLGRWIAQWERAWTAAREAGLSRSDAWSVAWSPADRGAFVELGDLPVPMGGTLVDVGANRGQFLDQALRRFRPRRAVAFEPLPSAFSELEQRFGSDSRCQLRPVALGSEPRSSTLRVLKHDPASSLLELEHDADLQFVHRDLGETERHEVEERRLAEELDALDVGRVDLLKLDVQGYELEVLRGAGKRLDSVEVLLTEVSFYPVYEGGVEFWELHRWLADRGFVLYGLSGPQRGAHGAVLQADAVYRRRSRTP